MSNGEKYIFITGAASGIGLASARHLHQLGFSVIVGVYPGEDDSGLDSITGERLHKLSIDITKTDMIVSARQAIERITGGHLYGLFNNAGMAIPGPIEFVPIEAIRQQLDVNLIGHVEVTQHLLPFIRAAQGRIVNTTSILGRVTTVFSAPYCMSKYALEAFTDALRQELAPFGVAVSAIEPGNIKTAIWRKTGAATEEIDEELPPEARPLYGDVMQAFKKNVAKISEEGIPPERVAQAVGHAFTAKRPKTRYVVGSDAKLIAFLRRVSSDRFIDGLLERRYPTKS